MSDTRLTFKRYEKKYILSEEKYRELMEALKDRICPDRFFSSTVCSIYYDTPNYQLIRNSIEKPPYKEKLRLRSYNIPTPDSEVFVELKKKYKGTVYKRRIAMSLREAEAYLAGKSPAPEDSQIAREIDWFLKMNDIKPAVFIGTDREAYVACDNPELRITFDKKIRWRETDLNFSKGDYGEEILPHGYVLMELKIPDAAPVWLARILSELNIFSSGFSKYGEAYKNNLVLKSIGVNADD